MGLFDKLDKPVFLKEESDITLFISKLKELQDKAIGKIKEDIEKEIKLASFGEVGENNIAFELKNSGMPMYIMHDIHLEIDGLTAQIDYIVVTRKVTFIIECKNLIGDIEIDGDGSFIRSYPINGRHIKEGIYSPITQNQRHLEVLRRIKKDSRSSKIFKMLIDKFFDEMYVPVVVLANPKTVLKAKDAKTEVKKMVIKADQLINYIKDVNQKSKMPTSNDKEMKEIAEGLLKLHTPNKTNYTQKYEEIISSISDVDEIDSAKVQAVKVDSPKNKEVIVTLKTIDNKDELVKKLKEYRLQKSREENYKPFYIFTDKQMADLIEQMPSSKEELMNISGFGQVKTEKYGDMIVNIINEYK